MARGKAACVRSRVRAAGRVVALAVGFGTCGALGCSPGDGEFGGESVRSVSESILNGTQASNQTDERDIVFIQYQFAPGTFERGSGTLLSPRYVLTAEHTFDEWRKKSLPATDIEVRCGSCGGETRRVKKVIPHPGSKVDDNDPLRIEESIDVALLEVDPPFTPPNAPGVYPRALSTRTSAQVAVLPAIACYGYGQSILNDSSSQGTLRSAILPPGPIPPKRPGASTHFIVRKNTAGQLPYKGDSGGPCADLVLGEYDVYGVMSYVDNEQNPTYEGTVAASVVRDWAAAKMGNNRPPLTGDFDLDGQDDAVTFGQGAGGNLQVTVVFTDPRLPDLTIPTPFPGTTTSAVAAGDFDNNGAPDLIGLSDSFSYYFEGIQPPVVGLPGGLTPSSFQGTGQNYEYFTVEDFDGDGYDDAEAARADGTADIFYGGPNGLSGVTAPRPRGFDVDGDRKDDIAFGSPGPFFGGQAMPGTVVAIHGDGSRPIWFPNLFDTGGMADRDGFGSSLSWGDFDGNGLDEAVIGAPGAAGGGRVYRFALHGEYKVIDQAALGQSVTGVSFGAAVAAGDFNGDAVDDLAIGVPGPGTSGGSIRVLRGVAQTGLSLTNSTTINRADVGVSGTASGMSPGQGMIDGSSFGSHLTSGDFNCDGFEDLAVGAPGATSASLDLAGAVIVLYGSSSGLSATRFERWDQSITGLGDSVEARDFFGGALAAGNFNGDHFRGRPCIDLVIGVPDETRNAIGGFGSDGIVHVLPGSPTGLTTAGALVRHQGSPLGDTGEELDLFGVGLAISRIDDDEFDDLVVGAPGEDFGAGAIHLLYGSANGLLTQANTYRQSDFGDTSEGTGGVIGFVDAFGYAIGGPSNGGFAVGSPFEGLDDPANNVLGAGMLALFQTDASGAIVDGLGLDQRYWDAAPHPYSSIRGLRPFGRLGTAITAARPAFVRRRNNSEHYDLGTAVPTGGGGELAQPWAMFRGSALHQGWVPVSGPDDDDVVWSAFVPFPTRSSPAITRAGRVIVGNSFGVDALDSPGILVWRTVLGRVDSSPAVGADGTVYVGSDDRRLHALSPQGVIRWSYLTGGAIDSSPVVAPNQRIYVGSDDRHLYAISPEGTLVWRLLTGGAIDSSPAVGYDGTIYVGSDDRFLYAVSPNGAQKWRFATGGAIDSSPAVGADGTIYVGSDDGFLYALNPNGTLRWRVLVGFDVESSPAVAPNGRVYVGSDNGHLYAVENGQIRWRYFGLGPVHASPVVDREGNVYIASDGFRLLSLTPEGLLRWQQLTFGPVEGSPALGLDGTLYALAKSGVLFAVRSP